MKGTRDFGRAFLDGFTQWLRISRLEGERLWESYSYQLSDTERRRIEARGWRAGQAEARKYQRWFAENNKQLETIESVKCPDCLVKHVDIVDLVDGKCPKCGYEWKQNDVEIIDLDEEGQ